jgi:hypothetical protein
VKIGNLVHVLSAQQIFGLIVVGNLPELFSQVELLLATLQLTRANTQSENDLARLLELRAGGASLQTLPHQATAWSKEAIGLWLVNNLRAAPLILPVGDVSYEHGWRLTAIEQ